MKIGRLRYFWRRNVSSLMTHYRKQNKTNLPSEISGRSETKIHAKDSEFLLSRLTCYRLINESTIKNKNCWYAILAFDSKPIIKATPCGSVHYSYEPIDKTKTLNDYQLFKAMEKEANEYLKVTQNGIDLLVNRLFPDLPEFRLMAGNWYAFNGLEAATKILTSRKKTMSLTK